MTRPGVVDELKIELGEPVVKVQEVRVVEGWEEDRSRKRERMRDAVQIQNIYR